MTVTNKLIQPMALFGDLKKLFFGAKSVAKSQARKAGDAASELTDDLKDQARDLGDDLKEAATDFAAKAPGYVAEGKAALENLSDKIWEEADAAVDKGKELKDRASEAVNSKLEELRPAEPEPVDLDADIGLDLSDLGMTEVSEPAAPKSGSIDFEADLIEDPHGSLKQAGEGLKNAAASALAKAKDATAGVRAAADQGLDVAARTGADLAGKVGDVSEKVGEQVLEKGDIILGRAAELGADLKSKTDAFIDHASQEAEKMKMEETIEEARRAAEVAEARARAFDGKEAQRDTSESTLSGTDSFFDRAARFAEGDYHDEGGKPVRVIDNPDYVAPKKDASDIAGFLDADGDGDALIDDATIIEEE